MDFPTFFSDKNELINYDYNKIDKLFNSEINKYIHYDNLSVPDLKLDLCKKYYKSIVLGYNHIFIENIMKQLNTNSNICLPLLNTWNDKPSIDNLVIISHPDDSEKICKKHIKKAPIFKKFLYNSIISTTDNEDWKTQRGDMNMAFLPKLSLSNIFPISQNRANKCVKVLKDLSENFTKTVNISEFFLNETQAQLQLSMFGFTNKFQEKTNKKLRNAFAGINTEYIEEFTKMALLETQKSNGPLSNLFDISDDEKKNIGNCIIFSFAGHDTTAHTLTWLLYELCKHPKYKKKLIDEIDKYWQNNTIESYDTFKQLPYMTKCITEILRLWPALANGTYRELETNETIHGIDGNLITIPKGTYCQIINWTRHRSKELWGDDVNIFNPDRKFKDSEIWNYEGFNTYNVSSNRFSPFTYGPRNCIGKNFSHLEMRLILLNIFKYYDFSLSREQLKTVNNNNYKGINTFTMGPQSINNNELIGMYLNIYPRKSNI
jgi:cytochrome P450